MDEIDALNEEWNKIKSRGLQVEDSARGANSNSSDACNSGSRRKKRSRWSDDKVALDKLSNEALENTIKKTAVVNDFSQNISKLVEERKTLERLAQERSDAADIQAGGSNGNQQYSGMPVHGGVDKTIKRQNPGPHSFRLSDNDDEEDGKRPSYRFKKQRKYRFKKDSSNSESESESPVVKTSNFAFRQVSKEPESSVHEDTNSGISSYLSSEPTAPEATPIGPFLEKKTTVVVKNVADWVTASHILQDVKNAQLRSYEDVGIVRKRERGSPYRYAYVDFLTNTSARRWVDIRKGKVVIGSQTYQMELTVPDWECPRCKVFNFGKSVLCYSCRTPKKVLLQASIE